MKRRAFKVFVFLLTGAIINVMAGWGLWICAFAARGPFFDTAPSAADVKWWQDNAPATFVTQPENVVVINSFGHYTSTMEARTGPTTRQIAYRMAAGWPMRAFEGVVWTDLAKKSGNLIQPGVFRPQWNETLRDKGIPSSPIWSGLAINTIFYAAIVWVLFAAPVAMRRRIRRKRGQCAACGYSLRGRGNASDRCPECGNGMRRSTDSTDDTDAG